MLGPGSHPRGFCRGCPALVGMLVAQTQRTKHHVSTAICGMRFVKSINQTHE